MRIQKLSRVDQLVLVGYSFNESHSFLWNNLQDIGGGLLGSDFYKIEVLNLCSFDVYLFVGGYKLRVDDFIIEVLDFYLQGTTNNVQPDGENIIAVVLIVWYLILLYLLPHATLILEVNRVMGITHSNRDTGSWIAYNFDQVDTIVTELFARWINP